MPIDPQRFAGVRFFALLDEEDRKLLANVVDVRRVREGETLFDAGYAGDDLYIVSDGEIELFIKDISGDKITLTVAKAGDFFGELALADSGPRTATARALCDSELIVLDRAHLLFFVQKKPDAALDMIAAMGSMIRSADQLLRTRVSRNVNVEMEETLTPLERAADWIAWFSGSMPFLALNALWFLGWISINTWDLGVMQFDPFPFGLLTMIVSLEAIFLSIFVLISQNRQTEKDRLRSNIEYEVNVKAELEIAQLHEKTDRIHEKLSDQFARLEKLIAERRLPH